ncbi:TRM11 family SAM-dependent methyltransferase [Mesobacillus foraminis]|uniref:TRM11 family SAM-dependent methyltransferase n=1 Tax=Mesobacillus foraminis TaxID=279826 RepID=UPI001044ED15|nr:RsmD family RNA methyltransferase [Mesobacillus foraminis]
MSPKLVESSSSIGYDENGKGAGYLAVHQLESTTYIYTYSCAEEELSLCRLERRCMFGIDTELNAIEAPLKIEPSRSPFIKERIEVLCTGDTLEALINKIRELPEMDGTFKVLVINHNGDPKSDRVDFKERRGIERKIGQLVPGQPDLHDPEILLGIIQVNGKWFFGPCVESRSIWFLHQQKPHQYSTALSTRVARAAVNIAVPHLGEQKVIDPCCGIGTVLVEALSMGIHIIGSDNNPLVMKGARENIAHFGHEGEVLLRDIREINGRYDVAIIDMPYNLCSVISAEEKREMLQSARGFAKKAVIITVEPMDEIIIAAGFTVVDRGEVFKGKFKREILVCK